MSYNHRANNKNYQQPYEPRPPQRRTPQNSSFQSLFELAANRLGIGTEVKSIRICHEARKILAELLPGHGTDLEVISFQNGSLNLRASSSPLRQKLFTKKHLLQDALNHALGAKTVSKISIRTA